MLPLDLSLALCVLGPAAVALLWARRHCSAATRALAAEHALLEELEAYAGLPLHFAVNGVPHALARNLCAVITGRSSFASAALLLRTAGTSLQVVGSAGVDDLLERALNSWGERFTRAQQQNSARIRRRRSYTITLGPLDPLHSALLPTHDPLRDDPKRPTRSHVRPSMCTLTILPLETSGGTILGALAVTAPRGTSSALKPLEALAAQLSRALENASLNERLRRAEKMAGLAHLARGVAHELNNPLTAVIGYAELIAAVAHDPAPDPRTTARCAADAQAILAQAGRMQHTIGSLLDCWRPPNHRDEVVDLSAMIQSAASAVALSLSQHRIALDLELGDNVVHVFGDANRLGEMLSHLLSNASEAVARYSAPGRYDAGSRPAELAPAIRITLACEGDTLQLVLSDTGPGFDEPARIFDPFYTTRPPASPDGKAQGLGLALAYGIAREHGGDISAINLYPHGAAVIVDLPIARTLARSGEHVVAEHGVSSRSS